MNFDWKSWCRFCGNAENNVKFESTIDIEYYFKISDSSSKICQQCSVALEEFEGFLLKTEKSNQLYQELANHKNLDHFKINKIRESFELDLLEVEIDLLENCTVALPELQIKDELEIYDIPEFQELLQDIKNKEETTDDKKSETHNSLTKKRRRRRTPKKIEVKPLDPIKQKEIESQESINEIFRPNCHVCDMQCTSMIRLYEHYDAKHNCDPQVSCICGRLLVNYVLFKKHRRRCCKEIFGIYECDLCPKSYGKKHTLVRHMRMEHINVVKVDKHICKICKKEYKSKYCLKTHMELIHVPQETREKFACEHCDKKFKSKFYLGTHIAVVHENKKRNNFTCHICAKSFGNKQILEQHIEIHNTTLNYECGICSRKFKSKELWKVHKRVHEPKKFFCEICNKGFNRAQGRTNHMITHSDERPFACPEPNCEHTFKRKGELEVHHNRVHLGKQRNICRFCGADFYYTKERFNHIKEQHPKEFVEFEERYRLCGRKWDSKKSKDAADESDF